MGRLSKRQRRFCDEYLIDCNATQAAIRAGYSEKTAAAQGAKLTSNLEVREYIDEQLELLHDQRTAKAKEVLEYLTSVMRGELKEQILCMAGDGTQEIIEIDISAKDRIRAAELIGKRYGLFNDKYKIESAVPVIISGIEALED